MYRPAKPIRLSTHNTGVRNNKKCACVVCTIQCYYIHTYQLYEARYMDWKWHHIMMDGFGVWVWVGGWGNSTDLHEESKGR